MTLDEAQKEKVRQWIAEGLKLADIQTRLEKEYGLRMTYMEARFIVDDLKLTPKDPTPPPAPKTPPPAPEPPLPTGPGARAPLTPPGGSAPAQAPRRVSITVDTLPRPGAFVSGGVTFSDGNSATWMLDQSGRLGLAPKTPGYRPPEDDIDDFQVLLQEELSKLGV